MVRQKEKYQNQKFFIMKKEKKREDHSRYVPL